MRGWFCGELINLSKTCYGLLPAICSNLRYSRVTCVILSNFCNFSLLILSTYPLLLYQFLSSYQTFVIFSPLVIYSTFPLSTHPLNAPALHTTTQLLISSRCAHALCAKTLSQLNSRLWPSCHFDLGRSRHSWGVSRRTTGYLQMPLGDILCPPPPNPSWDSW